MFWYWFCVMFMCVGFFSSLHGGFPHTNPRFEQGCGDLGYWSLVILILQSREVIVFSLTLCWFWWVVLRFLIMVLWMILVGMMFKVWSFVRAWLCLGLLSLAMHKKIAIFYELMHVDFGLGSLWVFLMCCVLYKILDACFRTFEIWVYV